MTPPKSRRRPPLTQALACFIPALAAVAVAGLGIHPLTLIPLLLANALTMAAICHAIGFDPEPNFARSVLRRGAAYLVMFSLYALLVFMLVAWPMLQLTHAPTPWRLAAAGRRAGGGAGPAVAAVAGVRAGVRVGRRLSAPAMEDRGYSPPTLRSVMFGRHLSREERFFSHFLPAALALLAPAFGAIALTGLYGVIPFGAANGRAGSVRHRAVAALLPDRG